MYFLRYPGGKNKLLNFLAKYLIDPSDITGRYIEPFVGGGSVLWYLKPEQAVISDLNHDLIDLYKGIKKNPRKVWEIFNSFSFDRVSYYRIRDQRANKESQYYCAARVLYLNRTCFKGMWRHNKEGEFNVGYGGEDRRWAITQENLIVLSKILKKVDIEEADFEKILDDARPGDFIFLDPPYKPGAKEMDHGHYFNGKFSYEDQRRLAKKLINISKRKVKWIMTNTSHEAIRLLYKGFKIINIPKGTSSILGVYTKNKGEILISNY